MGPLVSGAQRLEGAAGATATRAGPATPAAWPPLRSVTHRGCLGKKKKGDVEIAVEFGQLI